METIKETGNKALDLFREALDAPNALCTWTAVTEKEDDVLNTRIEMFDNINERKFTLIDFNTDSSFIAVGISNAVVGEYINNVVEDLDEYRKFIQVHYFVRDDMQRVVMTELLNN